MDPCQTQKIIDEILNLITAPCQGQVVTAPTQPIAPPITPAQSVPWIGDMGMTTTSCRTRSEQTPPPPPPPPPVPVPVLIPTIFNTGVDANRQVLPDFSPDPHYDVTQTVTTGPLPEPYPIPSPAKVWGPITGGWISNASDTTSKWIALNYRPPPWNAVASNSVPYPGQYEMTTSFDLTGFIHTTADIKLIYAVDDTIDAIFLNNQAVLGYPIGSYSQWSPEWTIPNTHIQSGVNTLRFKWTNGGNVGGIRLRLSGTAIPV
jgi:hypothetical protein